MNLNVCRLRFFNVKERNEITRKIAQVENEIKLLLDEESQKRKYNEKLTKLSAEENEQIKKAKDEIIARILT